MAQNLGGRHCRLFMNFDSEPIPLRTKNVTVKELATTGGDDINGANRKEYFKYTDGFEVTLSCFQNSGRILHMLIANVTNDDAEVAKLKASFAFVLHILDGTRVAFKVGNLTLAPWTLNIAGMNEKVMLDFGFNATEFGAVEAVR